MLNFDQARFEQRYEDTIFTLDEVYYYIKIIFINQLINLSFFIKSMVLIGLVYKYFCDNIKTKKYPNHLIRVSKQDISSIKEICLNNIAREVKLANTTLDLSKLERLGYFLY